MTKTELIENAQQGLIRQLGEDELSRTLTREELLAWLSEKIVYLLMHDMEKLLHILYRIDVKESLVKEIFAQNNPKIIAPGLAELMLNRELEKALTRLKYRKS